VSVESIEGEGSTFRLRLPLAPEVSRTAEHQTTEHQTTEHQTTESGATESRDVR
jgi:hypothetical protein